MKEPAENAPDDFEAYTQPGEPEMREKCYAWRTAIGLQAVDNLILSEHNELRNRAMLVSDPASLQNPSPELSPKCNFCTLNCTLEELALLNSRQSVGPVPD